MITTNDPIAALDRMAQEGYDIYEAAVSIAVADETDLTVLRWRQGDIALRIERHYGDETVDKLAKDASISVNTMRQRQEMSRFYAPDTRVLYPNLGYSHYREAKRLGNAEKAVWALGKAEAHNWTVEYMGVVLSRYMGKPARAEAVTGAFVSHYGLDKHSFVVRCDESVDWQPGDVVTIRKVAK